MLNSFSSLHINLPSFAYVVIGKWQPQRCFAFVVFFSFWSVSVNFFQDEAVFFG